MQFDEPELITEVQVDASGGFDVRLVPQDIGNCNPGSSFAFVAGPASTMPYTPGPWPVAIYDVKQLGEFSLTPSTFSCCAGQQSALLSGSGFPPLGSVHVFGGGAEPLADNFASLGDFTADANGEIEVEVPLIGGSCDPEYRSEQAAIYGIVEGLDARWKALYDIVP